MVAKHRLLRIRALLAGVTFEGLSSHEGSRPPPAPAVHDGRAVAVTTVSAPSDAPDPASAAEAMDAIADTGVDQGVFSQDKEYHAKYMRYRRRMNRRTLPEAIKGRLNTVEGRRDMWNLFVDKDENIDQMVSHLLQVTLEAEQKQTRVNSWITRSKLTQDIGEDDCEKCFAAAKLQQRWRKHPSAPEIHALEQIYFLTDDTGASTGTARTTLQTSAEVDGQLAHEIAAGVACVCVGAGMMWWANCVTVSGCVGCEPRCAHESCVVFLVV